MKLKCLFTLSFAFIPMAAFSADLVYCPQKQGYINVGMTTGQVMDRCGPPTSRQNSDAIQVTEKIPVTQLIYTTLNQGAVYPAFDSYYNMWSLPSGSTGTSLQVNIIKNKVAAVNINGSNTNAMSVCGGVSIQVGDDENRVYSACGNPSLVNETFINQPVAKSQQPEVWIYQSTPYQPTINLTFINGNLQSIQ